MNLVVDEGNTFTKVAVFEGNSLVAFSRLNIPGADQVRNLISEYPSIDQGIISSVNGNPQSFVGILRLDFPWLIFDHQTRIPLRNRYSTPQTLGLDRLAGATAAGIMYPGRNVLIIDAGTAITYDFINSSGEYLGGAISPGLKMRYSAMHTFTGRLPLLEIEEGMPLIGNSTHASMHSGVMNGALFEANGFIASLQADFPDLVIILTGGDHNYFDKQLKVKTFAAPNLVLEGLNFILSFNLEKH